MTELGRITPKKIYQTTDGKQFNELDEAIDHQRRLNEETSSEEKR
jgi:hypothetical protein